MPGFAAVLTHVSCEAYEISLTCLCLSFSSAHGEKEIKPVKRFHRAERIIISPHLTLAISTIHFICAFQ